MTAAAGRRRAGRNRHLEHTCFDLRDVQLMVMAAERMGITPIVRTPGFDPTFILRLLDMGVQGPQLPHVNSAAQAREAVKAVRYAPLGVAGQTDHPKLVETITRVAQVVRCSGVTRLALPMHNPVIPRDAAQLRALGVGYANCAPTPEARLLKALQAQVVEARRLLG